MAIKEFKKILSQKWIIYFLFLLCFVNVFLTIRNIESDVKKADKKQEEHIKRIQNYDIYIDNISMNAKVISGFSLFDNGNNYQVKSAEKIVNAYKKVKNVKPKCGNYTAIEKVTDIGFRDIIVLIAILQCAIILINVDRKHGMLILLKSCKSGRTKLALGKIGALFIAVVSIETITFFIHFITLVGVFGCEDLMVPIQSVPDFYESSLPINIVMYLIVFVALKICVVFSYALFILVIVVLCDNSGIVYAITGAIIGLSGVASTKIMWDYAFSFIKIMSPITLINIKSTTEKYYNVNIGGIPFNVMSVGILIMVCYVLLFIVLFTSLFSKKILLHVKINLGRKKRKYKPKKPIGMLAMEYKKLLVTNKGILLLVLLCLIQGAILSDVNTSIDGEQKYYSNYMNDLEGQMSRDTERYIQEEKEYYKKVEEKYQKKQLQFLEGKISDAELSIAEGQYNVKMMPNDAFKRVLKQEQYLNRLNKDNKITGWYVNDIGINYLIHPNKIYNEKIAWIFMMLIMSVMVVICMAYEEQTGMDKLSNITIYGEKKLLNKKIAVVVSISLLIFIISNIPFLVLVIHSYDFGGVMAPVNSLIGFQDWIQIPILFILVGIYLIKTLIMLVATVIVILISRKLTGMIKKMAVSITVLVVPLIIMTIL